jgi:hypothetical protein
VSDKLLRHFQELDAAPSREGAREVFDHIVYTSQFSDDEFEVLCTYYANVLHEWSR